VIERSFGGGSPGATCGLGADNFSPRWSRRFNFAAGSYRFSVTGNDGVRLYIDGQLKIDKWFDQDATTYTTDVVLPAGDHDVKLEYYEKTGLAVARLNWTRISGP
jgi:PA14 domain